MVRSEKFGHFHLVYHFTVPLSLLSEFLKNMHQRNLVLGWSQIQSPGRVLYRKGFIKTFAIFTEKNLSWSPFFNKVAGWKHAALSKRFQHRCFRVNSAKFLRTNFLKNTYKRLLLMKLTFLITLIENDYLHLLV